MDNTKDGPSLERRALYTLLRMNWDGSSSDSIESWKIEEYRQWPPEHLFRALDHLGIRLNQANFAHYADSCDTPEELADLFVDEALSPEEEDYAYMLIFELWRRLEPEKISLSIFCDELDHQIALYDRDQADPEKLQDMLVYLEEILDENSDEGVDPVEVMEAVGAYCANDLESFLFDFILEQLEEGSQDYASELLDGFMDYMSDPRWLQLLYVRLWSSTDPEQVEEGVAELIERLEEEFDIELAMELLDLLSRLGRAGDFCKVALWVLDSLECKEDFENLLGLCIEYCHLADSPLEEELIAMLRESEEGSSKFPPKEEEMERFCILLKQLSLGS